MPATGRSVRSAQSTYIDWSSTLSRVAVTAARVRYIGTPSQVKKVPPDVLERIRATGRRLLEERGVIPREPEVTDHRRDLPGAGADDGGTLMVMSAVELNDEALEAARREAKRRGVGVTVVVSEAVQRFVVGGDLADLLDEFRQRDEASAAALDEREALRIANEELAVVRQARR